MHLEEKQLTSETIFEGKIFTITHDIVELENGQKDSRDVILHHGGVCIIPITENNEIYLVRQYRYPFRMVTREIPAGKLKKGEKHSECGRRELLEEIGCTCEEYIYLGEILPVPAYNTEITHIYLARGLNYVGQVLDKNEFLDVYKIPLTQAVELVMCGKITDGKTQIGILKTARILRV